jgi:hypothetical protein
MVVQAHRESEEYEVMKNIGTLALCASLFLTLGGWEAVNAHAVLHHPISLTLLERDRRRQQEAALIAKIRDLRSFKIKNHLTGLEETIITEKSLAGHPHTFIVKSGRIRLITEAIIKRDEERARLLEELREEKHEHK